MGDYVLAMCIVGRFNVEGYRERIMIKMNMYCKKDFIVVFC